jgi:RNase P/RNase MRP subunit p29
MKERGRINKLNSGKLDGFLIENIIGKHIKILSCKNKFNNYKSGIVVNETKNMIYMLQNNKKPQITRVSKKEINLYKIILPIGDYFINGKTLLGRPEEKVSIV